MKTVAIVAGENLLLGTWKLKSFVQVLETGEHYNVYGERPDGYISYSADGRMYAIVTSDGRPKPRDENPPDDELIRLHNTMFAYAGTYTAEGDKLIHRVDISWNQSFTGTEQVRHYRLDGEILTITTAPTTFTMDGREGHLVAAWEKVKAPTR
jgi:beta-glucanase (GH16 family)